MAELNPTLPEVTAQKKKLVGDDKLEVREVTVEVNEDQVDAQVVQPRELDSKKVNVHEVVVATDRVITDTSDPLAVQVPDAGRGDASLPAHRLAEGHIEDVFASESSDDAPYPPA